MKFSYSVIIDAPRQDVVSLFIDSSQLHHWQDGFISKTPISGVAGTKDAQALMLYKMGKRSLGLTETIIYNDLPDAFCGLYEARQMSNTMTSHFDVLGPERTKYTADVDYIKMNSLGMRLIAWLFPAFFKNQVKKWIDQFKHVVEQKQASS